VKLNRTHRRRITTYAGLPNRGTCTDKAKWVNISANRCRRFSMYVLAYPTLPAIQLRKPKTQYLALSSFRTVQLHATTVAVHPRRAAKRIRMDYSTL
jgi:hypothetical protein